MKCLECDKGFCRDNSGRVFWSHHVATGVCPVARVREKRNWSEKLTAKMFLECNQAKGLGCREGVGYYQAFMSDGYCK